MRPSIVVHGGAAIIASGRVAAKMDGVRAAARRGYDVLRAGGSALEAVERAVAAMEDNPVFNAGYGSVLNADGNVEMDASIMEGRELRAGAVALVQRVRNPIQLARLVMERSVHVLLVGRGAERFAETLQVPLEEEPGALVSEYSRHVLDVFLKNGCRTEDRELGGTVGAAALDGHGDVAAGTSTGGTNGKLPGRVGDSPLLGCGTYATNGAGAVSATGHGEAIMRHCLAHAVVDALRAGECPSRAAAHHVHLIKERLHSNVGAVCVSSTGAVGISFSTRMMPWAYCVDGCTHYGLLPGEHHVND